jgi:hypothetical protein
MKTNFLSSIILFAAFAARAQSQSFSSGDVISRSPGSNPGSSPDQISITNSAGESYSLDRITTQLRELHRAVEETMPMLNAVSQSQSNSVATGQSGGLAGILGGILNRTNQTASSGSEQHTNSSLGGILRGVLGNTAASTTNSAMLNDLVALRDQLETITPILQRLTPDAANNSDQIARPTNSGTNNLTPTGRE